MENFTFVDHFPNEKPWVFHIFLYVYPGVQLIGDLTEGYHEGIVEIYIMGTEWGYHGDMMR